MQHVVGLLGLRGSGKDTAANVLIAKGYQRLSFGDPIYREVTDAFGVTVAYLQDRKLKETPRPELALAFCRDRRFVSLVMALAAKAGEAFQNWEFLHRPRSPREILQVWGTEYRRDCFGLEYWLDQVRQHIRRNPNTNFVLTDVRYPNEAELVTVEFGGSLGRVIRPALDIADARLLHPSEATMQNYPVQHVFVNEEGQLGALLCAVEKAFLGSTVSPATCLH